MAVITASISTTLSYPQLLSERTISSFHICEMISDRRNVLLWCRKSHDTNATIRILVSFYCIIIAFKHASFRNVQYVFWKAVKTINSLFSAVVYCNTEV